MEEEDVGPLWTRLQRAGVSLSQVIREDLCYLEKKNTRLIKKLKNASLFLENFKKSAEKELDFIPVKCS